jgi:hypothetical protein
MTNKDDGGSKHLWNVGQYLTTIHGATSQKAAILMLVSPWELETYQKKNTRCLEARKMSVVKVGIQAKIQTRDI